MQYIFTYIQHTLTQVQCLPQSRQVTSKILTQYFNSIYIKLFYHFVFSWFKQFHISRDICTVVATVSFMELFLHSSHKLIELYWNLIKSLVLILFFTLLKRKNINYKSMLVEKFIKIFCYFTDMVAKTKLWGNKWEQIMII